MGRLEVKQAAAGRRSPVIIGVQRAPCRGSLLAGRQTSPDRPTCLWEEQPFTSLVTNHFSIFLTTFRRMFPQLHSFLSFLSVLLSKTISPPCSDTVWLLVRLPVVTGATSKRSGTLQLDSNRLPWRYLGLEKRPDLFVVVSLLVSPRRNSSRHE